MEFIGRDRRLRHAHPRRHIELCDTGTAAGHIDGIRRRPADPKLWGYIHDILEALERFFWRDQIEYPGPLNIDNDREVPILTVASTS